MAAINMKLLENRFAMLARDLGWPLAHQKTEPVKEWEGKYHLAKFPLAVIQYVGDGGGERNVSGYISTRREMLAWIEGAECAVKAMRAKLHLHPTDMAWPRNNDT